MKEFPEFTEEQRRNIDAVFSANFEEFALSKLIYVALSLQARCAHCSTGRETPDHCFDCDKKIACDLLEKKFQELMITEAGCVAPTFKIPKTIDRQALNLREVEKLKDRPVRISVKDMFTVEAAVDQVCDQCRDHHPDRIVAGHCAECGYSLAKLALDLDNSEKPDPRLKLDEGYPEDF